MASRTLRHEEAPQCSVEEVIADPDIIRSKSLPALPGFAVSAPSERHEVVQLGTSCLLCHQNIDRILLKKKVPQLRIRHQWACAKV